MKQTVLAAVLAACLSFGVSAQDGGLFLNSKPIRAEVILDGTPIGITPLLVRNLEPGDHEVTLIKPGYLRQSESIVVPDSEYVSLTVTLEPNVFVGAFAANETEVAGTLYSRQDARLILPAGTYEFSQSGTRLSLNPVYPNESALRGLRVATPVVVIAAIIATIEDLIIVEDPTRNYFTSRQPSPATFAAWTAAAASSGFLIALNRDKARYESEKVIEQLETELTDAEAEQFYLQGDLALEAGNLETALTNYTRVVVDGGDSEYVPLSLYKAARIYSISGQTDLALPLFELIAQDYPVQETYDRSLKSIADIYQSDDVARYDDAIAALERMVFADSFYDRTTISEDIESIREKARNAGGGE